MPSSKTDAAKPQDDPIVLTEIDDVESDTDIRLAILETRIAELQAVLVSYLPNEVTAGIRADETE